MAKVWTIGGTVATARATMASHGTRTATFITTGSNGANQDSTEEYDGTVFSAGGTAGATKNQAAGMGTLSAGLMAGGYSGAALDTSEEYNGTSWSAGGTLVGSRFESAGAGTQSAGLVIAGYSGGYLTTCEEYNGTSWSSGGAITTGTANPGACGTQSDAAMFGGSTGAKTTTCEEYNGTSWSSGGAITTATDYPAAGGNGGVTDAIIFTGRNASGRSSDCETYNGTTWSSSTSSLIAVFQAGGAGVQSDALCISGRPTSGYTQDSQEYGDDDTQGIAWITTTEVTPGSATTWTDVDNANIPDGAEGVILHIVNKSTTTAYAVGFRKNGSTDARTTSLKADSHFWTAIGVDATGIFELYVGDTTNIDVWLLGYFKSGTATFFDNAVDKSLVATAAWTDIDISSDTGANTAIGAVFEIIDTGGATTNYGTLRKNGSGDDRTPTNSIGHWSGIVGVDSNEICEGKIESTNVDFYLVGYIKSGMSFYSNAVDNSLTTTAAWTDLNALPTGANGGLFEVHNNTSTAYQWGLRKNGDTENIINDNAGSKEWGLVELDGSLLSEGYIENANVDFWVTGFSLSGADAVASGNVSKVATIDWANTSKVATIAKASIAKVATISAA